MGDPPEENGLTDARGRRKSGSSLLHFGGIDGVSAPAPSCGGGPGWGVALTGEIINGRRSRLEDGATPSLVLPHKEGGRGGPVRAETQKQRALVGRPSGKPGDQMSQRLKSAEPVRTARLSVRGRLAKVSAV